MLVVDTTIDAPLQREVSHFLQHLADPEFVKQHGIHRQERLLPRVDPGKVIYSFVLSKRRNP